MKARIPLVNLQRNNNRKKKKHKLKALDHHQRQPEKTLAMKCLSVHANVIKRVQLKHLEEQRESSFKSLQV